MADANTTLYGLVKPEVGASADTWGAKTNADWDDVDALLGAFVLTGSTSAYVLTTGLSLAAYAAKQRFLVKWNHTNGTTPTLNVDGLGAKNIKKRDGSTTPSNSDLVSGVYNEVVYDGTNFVVVNLLPSDYQPLDATLTALAALSWSSGNALVQFTAADTVSLTLTPSVTDITLSGVAKASAGAVGAPSYSFSGETNTGIYKSSAGIMTFASSGTANFAVGASVIDCTTSALRTTLGNAGTPAISHRVDTNTGIYFGNADDMYFTLGGTLRATWNTTLNDFTIPTRARAPTSSETTGTLTSASANKVVVATGGVTFDGNVFTAGDMVCVYAGASARTLTQGATGTPTQRLHGTSTTGNLTLAARGWAMVYFISATEWVVSGDVS